jgi:hypothetical protein
MSFVLLMLLVSTFVEKSLQQVLNSTQHMALMRVFDELGECRVDFDEVSHTWHVQDAARRLVHDFQSVQAAMLWWD